MYEHTSGTSFWRAAQSRGPRFLPGAVHRASAPELEVVSLRLITSQKTEMWPCQRRVPQNSTIEKLEGQPLNSYWASNAQQTIVFSRKTKLPGLPKHQDLAQYLSHRFGGAA